MRTSPSRSALAVRSMSDRLKASSCAAPNRHCRDGERVVVTPSYPRSLRLARVLRSCVRILSRWFSIPRHRRRRMMTMMHKPTSPSLLHVSTDQAPAITARLHLHTEGPFCSGIKVEISVSKLRQKHCTNSRGVGSNCRQPLIKCTKCMREMGGATTTKNTGNKSARFTPDCRTVAAIELC